MGTEYSQTNDIINNYKNLQKEIDNLILKKEAQFVLEANEEKYKEAIKNKTKLYEDYLSTQQALADKKQEIIDIESQWYLFEGSRLSDLKKAEEQYNDLNNILSEQSEKIKEYQFDIDTYQENSKLALSGTAEDLKKIQLSTTKTYKSVTDIQGQELSKRIKQETDSLNQKQKIYDIEKQVNKNAKDSIYATNLEESQKNLSLISQELISMTNTVGELSPEIIEAWVNLAKGSRKEYNNAISQMPQDMQDKINTITAFVRNDTSVKNAVKFLGEEAVNQISDNTPFESAGINWIKGVTNGINNKTEQAKAKNSASIFSSTILGIINKVWDEHSPSRASEKSAINLIKGIPIGIKKEAPKAYKEVEKTASNILNAFNSNLNFESLQNIPKLQNSISQTINTQLKPKILSPTINITTQRLDNNEMSRIIDTVNRKLGEIY